MRQIGEGMGGCIAQRTAVCVELGPDADRLAAVEIAGALYRAIPAEPFPIAMLAAIDKAAARQEGAVRSPELFDAPASICVTLTMADLPVPIPGSVWG